MDLAQLLPDDVLVDVLGRLAPRSLAASRSVCKAWRAIVDAHRLLRADLLPLSLGGIFIMLNNPEPPQFFSRPSTGATVCGKLDYLEDDNIDYDNFEYPSIKDHCNGLLLLYEHVVNPATQQWVRLPPRPPRVLGMEAFFDRSYIVFDPSVSPYYEVFLIPRVPCKSQNEDLEDVLDGNMEEPEPPCHNLEDELDPKTEESEWPPSSCVLRVFSSKTGRWEERSFSREGEAMGTVADMRSDYYAYQGRYGVYWQGALYVHCQYNFIMRITLSNDKYRVIKPPTDVDVSKYHELQIGKSKKGVYCALVHHRCRLRVWFLNESCGQMEWVLTHHSNLGPALAHWNYNEQIDGPWILQDYDEDNIGEAQVEEMFEWNSDDDNALNIGYGVKDDNDEALLEEEFEWRSDDDILDTEDSFENCFHGYILFIGFHPYKEIVFLHGSGRRGIAYHLNSMKVQDLGNLRLNMGDIIFASFPYTPCWTGKLA